MPRQSLSSAGLFAAAARPGREDELDDLGLEVVARPGMPPPSVMPPGLFAIRRGLGEGNLAVVIAIERIAPSRRLLESQGIRCEGYTDGVFIVVDDGLVPPRGLRIAGPDGRVSRDIVLLRERPRTRVRAEPTSPSLGASGGTAGATGDTVFILDENKSTLELLPAADRDKYLTFAWKHGDYPGAPLGTNEMRALQMFVALSKIRPERRANRGADALVTEAQYDDAMQRRIEAALVSVPGETAFKLNRDAASAYVDMRKAAEADGVKIRIGNSYRTAAVAAANAAKAGNRNAVAKFSAHTLGLAVDLNMSHGNLRFLETTTKPFQNVVDMYKSPVHKWMFLRAQKYGWYPFQFEPWHWEYNPPGFKARYLSAAPPTPPSAPTSTPRPAAFRGDARASLDTRACSHARAERSSRRVDH